MKYKWLRIVKDPHTNSNYNFDTTSGGIHLIAITFSKKKKRTKSKFQNMY